MVGEFDVKTAADAVADALTPTTTHDWSALARQSEWTCWKTAEHICDVLFSYSGQLASAAESAYVKLLLTAEENAGPADLVEGIRSSAVILAATVTATDPAVRAYHPSGMADRSGFAAMGAAELLLHGDDVAVALGGRVRPADELCAKVLARIFPDVEPTDDSWATLLWATGRADLPGREHVSKWRWYPAPH
jgi:hypothetical protein